MRRSPGLFRFANLLYGSASNTWFHGRENGIEGIHCEEGSQQGCNLGNLLCGMAYTPLSRGLSKLLKDDQAEGAFSKFFVDDGTMVAPFDSMIKVLDFIRQQGPKVGYTINVQKSSYMIGRCEAAEAMRRRDLLIQYGLKEENILIHPDNFSNGQPDVDKRFTREKFGAKILGSYVGSPEFIESNLDKKLLQLKTEADILVKHRNSQEKYIFLKYCFDKKINHILRTTPFDQTEAFCKRFDGLKKIVLCSLLTQYDVDSLPTWVWTQSCLATTCTGLGLTDSDSTRYTAYLGSVVDCMQTLDDANPGWITDDTRSTRLIQDALAFVQNASECLIPLSLNTVQSMGRHKKDDEIIPNKVGRQHDLTAMMQEAILRRLKDSLDDKHLGWITSTELPMSEGFLNVLPKSPSQTFNSADFTILLNMRLYLPQPELIGGLRCDCKNRPIIDIRSHHLLTSCAKNAFGLRSHNAVCSTLQDMLRSTGNRVTREPIELFKNIIDPTISEKQKNSRPDLLVEGIAHGLFRTAVIDASWTSPIPIFGNQPFTRDMASIPECAAKIRFREKMTKYDDVAAANGLKFIPIIFENTGGIAKKSYKYLKDLLTPFDNRYKNGLLLKRYWLNRISCAYFHQLAYEIRTKSRHLKGTRHNLNNYENREDFIHESSSIYMMMNTVD